MMDYHRVSACIFSLNVRRGYIIISVIVSLAVVDGMYPYRSRMGRLCYTTGLVVDMSLGSYKVAAIVNNKTGSGPAVFLLSCFTTTLIGNDGNSL